MLTAVPPSTREFLLPTALSSREVGGKSALASWFSSLEFPIYGCSAIIPPQNLAGAGQPPSNMLAVMGLSFPLSLPVPLPILLSLPLLFSLTTPSPTDTS